MAEDKKLGAVTLGQTLHSDFPSSEAFIEKLGRFMGDEEFFLPAKNELPEGTRVEIAFTLSGRRDIVRGAAQVLSIHKGGGTLPHGMHMRWINMTERSARNVAMILAWQKDNQQH